MRYSSSAVWTELVVVPSPALNFVSGVFQKQELVQVRLNLYTYCSNEPLMYLDPSGHTQMSAVEALQYAWDVVKEVGEWLDAFYKKLAGDIHELYKAVTENEAAKLMAIKALSLIGLGAGLSMIGLPEIGTALFSAGLGLAATEIQDILEDGVYNKSAATYVEAAVFSGLMGLGAGAAMSSTVLTPTTKVLVMTAIGGGSSAAAQKAAKGEIDPKKVLTSAAIAEFSTLATQQFTRAFNKEIDDLAYVPKNSSAAFEYDEAAGTCNGENIVGTNYNQIRPTQDSINFQKVDEYVQMLRSGGKLNPVTAVEISGKGVYIIDGHHRFIASQMTGIPIEINILPGQGPIGMNDWSAMIWKDYINEFQFWGE